MFAAPALVSDASTERQKPILERTGLAGNRLARAGTSGFTFRQAAWLRIFPCGSDTRF